MIFPMSIQRAKQGLISDDIAYDGKGLGNQIGNCVRRQQRELGMFLDNAFGFPVGGADRVFQLTARTNIAREREEFDVGAFAKDMLGQPI
ncbi:unnamed protein product [Cuscuta campestris]|uniref:Uncharacterized protein n=1 Tax=Cuscuta campestris TaxID=132261 RepID=A0A484K0N7_9ASTE|nr:unnamed protein product [Cuscuta campestris]